MSVKMNEDLPSDWEPCAECGCDHSYEFEEARAIHMQNDQQESAAVAKHVEILVTGGGYETVSDDPGFDGLEDGEFLLWHPKNRHAYVVKIKRLVSEDEYRK